MLADGAAITDARVEPANLPINLKIQKMEEDPAVVVMAKAKARAEAALRAARLVWTAVVISADYKAFDVSQVGIYVEIWTGTMYIQVLDTGKGQSRTPAEAALDPFGGVSDGIVAACSGSSSGR